MKLNKTLIKHIFSKYLLDMGDTGEITHKKAMETLIIIAEDKFDNFINMHNEEIEILTSDSDLNMLFNKFLKFSESTNIFNFNIHEDIDNYKNSFLEAKILSYNDINKKKLENLCINIYEKSNDKNINNCSVLAIATAYLQTINKLNDDNELSYLELQYCDNQNGYLSNKLSLKDIINYIEGIDWLSKYLNNETIFSKLEIFILNNFSERFKKMIELNKYPNTELDKLYNIITKKKKFNNFIINSQEDINLLNQNIKHVDDKNLNSEVIISDLNNLFKKFKIFVEFNKSINFKIDEENKYYDEFINAGIYTHNDLDKKNILLLCHNILKKNKDKNIYTCDIYAVAKAYLQTINELTINEKLSYIDLLYCESKNGNITDYITLKNIINHIEGNEWLVNYLNKNNL